MSSPKNQGRAAATYLALKGASPLRKYDILYQEKRRPLMMPTRWHYLISFFEMVLSS
jgi:hypothetical protein